MAALLLSRKNTPDEVFKNYLDPIVFCRYWPAIKRKMRQDKWSEPRIIFWQAIYEKLLDRYRSQGLTFRKEASLARNSLCGVLGKKIRDARKKQGLSQKKLAKRLGISQQLISRIEKGGENMSLRTLSSISRALGKRIEINLNP